jgi:DNA processing protein
MVSNAEVVACIGLGLLPRVGPRTIRRWVERAGSAEAAWRRVPALTEGRTGRDEILAAWRAAEPARVLDAAHRRGITVTGWSDPAYPAQLRAITDPPPVLFVRGALNEAPAVAIVGSRRATPYGRAAAGQLAFDLARAGVTVASGLARGIDGAAHQAALDAEGRTIAVMGCGVDIAYPREHRRLADAIAASGAVVSEFAPGTPPLPGHFPRRNRLISGLSLGVIVVEGAKDSGALVTVDYALDQGREVFAVPGSIFSVRSEAPHRLLREGARVVERAADVLEELGLAQPRKDTVALGQIRPAGTDEDRILEALAQGPAAFEDVVDATALPAGRVAAALTMLELRGLIKTLPGQMVMQTPGAGARRASHGNRVESTGETENPA